MFRISEPAASPSRSSTIRILMLLLLLALVANSAAAWLAIQDYELLGRWLADPAPTPHSEIMVLRRQTVVWAVTPLVVSAVLVLCTAFFVWQRRRNLDIHQTLDRVQRLAHSILESMAQGVIAVDGLGIVREINPAAARLLGADPKAMGGLLDRPIAELPVAGAELDSLVREAFARDDPLWDREVTVGRDGLTLRLRADAQSIRAPDGRVGCILLLRDLTRLLLVEERMRRMERIAGLGDAASGLVHEIRNPLTALSIHIQLLEEGLARSAAPGEAAELIGVLKSEADRLSRILDEFWDYAHLDRPTIRSTDAVAVLEQVVQRIRPQAARLGVRVALRRPTGPVLAVPLDAQKFQRAVWNLAVNALEAMPSGGDLTIEAADRDGTFIVLVRDTGPGIAEEIRGDIFRPYFSTKGQGTGLGLALAEKVVGQHNGEIAMRTGPGGTSFELAFPRASRDGDRADDGDGRGPLSHIDRG